MEMVKKDQWFLGVRWEGERIFRAVKLLCVTL